MVLPFLVGFGCVKTSTGIYLAFNMLASFSDIKCFSCSNVFFQFFEALFLAISLATIVHILLAREDDTFVKQCRWWFGVNGTDRFDYVGLL